MGQGGGKMGYWGVAAIGVGGMVGGGIFAVLGLCVQLTRGAAPIAFLITAGATLAIANLFDISSISMMGSAGFLLVFAAVNGANAVVAQKTGSRRWIPLLGVALCLGALGCLIWEIGQRSPSRWGLP
jgi:amino acid transporter